MPNLRTAEAMAKPGYRPGREFTFIYPAMAICSSGLNRIVMFFVAKPIRASADEATHPACRKAVRLVVGEGNRLVRSPQ